MPPLDFNLLKRIPITEVCLRYKVSLKFRGVWASAICPLPTHKEGTKDRTFNVNTETNFWRCFSDSCCANNGGKKGGDVINFVASMERCSLREAAEKLVSWYGAKTAGPIAQPREKNKPPKSLPDNNSSSGSVKGYMHNLNEWLDGFLKRGDQESEVEFAGRLRKGFMNQIHRSFRNGKRVAQGLAPE